MPGQVGRDVALHREPRDPQPAAGDGGLGVRREGDEGGSPGRPMRSPGRTSGRCPIPLCTGPEFDRPDVIGEGRREMDVIGLLVRVPSTAAGSVAELFTTSRSPGCSCAPNQRTGSARCRRVGRPAA